MMTMSKSAFAKKLFSLQSNVKALNKHFNFSRCHKIHTINTSRKILVTFPFRGSKVDIAGPTYSISVLKGCNRA